MSPTPATSVVTTLAPSLVAVATLGNLDALDIIADFGEQQILKMYPEDSWRPDFPLWRFLEQASLRRGVREQRARALAVAIQHPVTLLERQAALDVEQLAWRHHNDNFEHTQRFINDETVRVAEALARVGQGQGNRSALDLTREFVAEVEKIEKDKALTQEEKHRRTLMYQESLAAQLRKS